MNKNFDKKNFVIHLGSDGLIYATCKKTKKLFVNDGFDWMLFEEFMAFDISEIEAQHNDEDFYC